MTIEEEIKNFKFRLLRKMPFYGDVVVRLNFIESDTVEVACTDGKNIFYNKEFFEELEEGNRYYILMHEIFHVILMHTYRGKGLNGNIWNIACDMVVNHMCDRIGTNFEKILKMPFTRPEQGIFIEIKDYETVENIYAKLMNDYNAKNKKRLVVNGYRVLGKGSGYAERITLKVNVDKANDLLESDLDEDFVKALIKMSADKSRGQEGSYFIPKEVFEIKLDKVINWKRLLKNFLQTDINDEISYTTPERKYIHMDLILPGYGPSEEKIDSIWTFIDSSGSVSHEELELFLSQIYYIAKEYGCITNICYWDTKVTDTYLNITKYSDIEKCTPKHSGGTDINCVYEWLIENKIKPDVMIILTDGYFGDIKPYIPLNRYAKKTIMVLSSNIEIDDNMKSFGKVTRLEK